MVIDYLLSAAWLGRHSEVWCLGHKENAKIIQTLEWGGGKLFAQRPFQPFLLCTELFPVFFTPPHTLDSININWLALCKYVYCDCPDHHLFLSARILLGYRCHVFIKTLFTVLVSSCSKASYIYFSCIPCHSGLLLLMIRLSSHLNCKLLAWREKIVPRT